ncbi:calmodulin 4, putative [Ricinus communis]|uniref:Calmodulin 4, putative n=1 Tax=Ricinus communis TaxID=3988 RepID=B9R7D4_RICCO|nr:calmodulin 4, putative [Ricinus communis]
MFASTNLKNVKCVKPMPIDARLKDAFRRFDTNGDGYLSVEELKNAYSTLGMSFPTCRAWRAVYVADENRDGYISEKEFQKLLKAAHK